MVQRLGDIEIGEQLPGVKDFALDLALARFLDLGEIVDNRLVARM
jgi:hypothetical protein